MWNRFRLPNPGEPRYEEYVEAFEIGVAGLDIGVGEIAEKNLSRAIELIPAEPAGWADRGLFYLRSRQFPKAASDLRQADILAPDNTTIQTFLGMLDEQEGRLAEAADRYRRVLDKDKNDIEVIYRLATVVQMQDPLNSDRAFQELMERILVMRPNNLYVLTARLRTAIKENDLSTIRETLGRFEKLSPHWKKETLTEFKNAKAAFEKDGDTGPMQRFANVLSAEPDFAPNATEVNRLDVEMGRPIRTFLKLAPVKRTPSPADLQLTLPAEPIAAAPAGMWDVVLPVWLKAEGSPAIFVANGKEIRRVGSDVALPSVPLAPGGVVALDWQNTFRTGLFAFGKGIRFYQQLPNGKFEDSTETARLPQEVLKGDFTAAIAADYDLDGDLDILLGRRTGSPLVLRNNLDGTFTSMPVFPEIDGARSFAWADFDNDGDPDLAVLDSRGRLHLFMNERSGRFKPWPFGMLNDAERILAIAVIDADDDGLFDLAVLREGGTIYRLSDRSKFTSWDYQEIAKWEAPPAATEPGALRLHIADLDNNGMPDIVASGSGGSAAWLAIGDGKFARLAAPLPANCFAAADLGDGRISLLAIIDGRPVRANCQGTQHYHWQTIRFRAERQENMTGDNRINSYGIGGEIEIRSGSLIVKRPIASPSVHFGLGQRSKADVIRIMWPNGTTQIEFQPEADQVFSPTQRLKGSCPFLFTWNGERFVFV
ncbi:MAG TPA: FG-GAP-like repeat-containing protein, partial [Gemmataceae bacterium]